MTKDKDFKTLIRERMAKTGESYATARANLLGPPGAENTEPRRFAIPDWPMTGRMARRRPPGSSGGPQHYVEVTADEVAVHNGSGTELHIPREAIVEARRCDGLRAVFRGVHRRHVHVLLGGGGTVVAIRLDRDVIVQVADEPSTLREVRVAVDDADALVALLN